MFTRGSGAGLDTGDREVLMSPPHLADRALRLLVRRGLAEDVIGDLHEEYALFKLDQLGPSAARFWYWQQALAVLWRFGRIRLPGSGHATALSADRHRQDTSGWIDR